MEFIYVDGLDLPNILFSKVGDEKPISNLSSLILPLATRANRWRALSMLELQHLT